MKKEDIVFGKWYTSPNWVSGSMMRIECFKHGTEVYGEGRTDNAPNIEKKCWSFNTNLRLATKEEISRYIKDYKEKELEIYYY